MAVQLYEPPQGLAPGERRWEPSKLLVPEKYISMETSGLEYTVEPGSNTIEIELTTE